MSKEMRQQMDTFKQRLTESENTDISDVSDSNSVSGLMFGMDGEIIQLTKYKKNWHGMFDEHKLDKEYKTLDKKYKTKENFEHFCYLNYMGIDAEAVFVQKIREIETE
jgi:hypothetical protein